MPYYDAFVIPVPTANKDKFIHHARTIDAIFIENGASRVVECWGDDVAHGKVTDFYRAVGAKEDEAIAFAWVEWPDRATRDKGIAATMDRINPDQRSDPASNPMLFDGARMIFGGFEPVVRRGDHASLPYVQGFMVPVPTAKRDAYAQMAAEAWDMVASHGALALLEAWGDDVPHGAITDFYRGVNANADESVVFSYMIWPSKAACQAAAKEMEEMEMPEGFEMPFDGKRMVWGGFEPVVLLEA